MEKKVDAAGTASIRVILTGPESTGKTELTRALAGTYSSPYIPEYARKYIENLGRRYTYDDVEHIAKSQVRQMEDFTAAQTKLLFVDTYLIITKVWFEWVYKKYPAWLDDALYMTKNDLYLLCKPDIPWYPDKVREHGGESRNVLFGAYEKELNRYGLQYGYVSGTGEERIMHATRQIEKFLAGSGNKFQPDER